MTRGNHRVARAALSSLGLGLLFASVALARTTAAHRSSPALRPGVQDDSVIFQPPKDLALQSAGQRKVEALTSYIQALDLQEEGESEKALAAFEKVLNVDPGEIDLASRVAFLLTQQGDYPRAIDILKDAVKAQPQQADPYLQLAYIYAKYLKKMEPAIRYAKQAVALAPDDIEGYQRLCEVQLAAGDRKGAQHTLDQAAGVQTNDPSFWTQLGKLYLALMLQHETTPKPADLQKVNAVFHKALALAQNDASVLKDAADYFAATQQVKDAIPLYLRVLELQPNDSNVREKLATGFLLTNQRGKAIQLLQEIIQQHPEQYQPYNLLGKVLEEDGDALLKDKKIKEATAEYKKAVASYEQSLLINAAQPDNYLHLGELLISRLHESDRAVKLLQEARRHFPDSPQITYLLAISYSEAQQAQQSVVTFEEALHEAEARGSDLANDRFFFEYGAAAERAGLDDKAVDLFKHSIELNPTGAAEAYNYLGFMWADKNTHLEEAKSYIEKAVSQDPENGAYLDSLGWVDYQLGHYDQALAELLNAAHALKEPDAVVFVHVGDTYEKLKQIPQALSYWEKALAIDKSNKKLAQKIEHYKTKVSAGEPAGATPLH